MDNTRHFENEEILGIPIGSIDMPTAVERILSWCEWRESRYVCACDVHSLMRAVGDDMHKRALQSADLVTPDGQPIVWTARMRGNRIIGRVCGPDLLVRVCQAAVSRNVKHYFYGGAEGVAQRVAQELVKEIPGIEIAGVESPPFRPLTATEEDALRKRVKASGARIMWVGLGCPKQEQWMLDHVGRFPGTVLIGIGAAFDFQSKRVKRAPLWMQKTGLEWLHRLLSEPSRLWRRYLVIAPQFVAASLAETARLRWARRRPARELRADTIGRATVAIANTTIALQASFGHAEPPREALELGRSEAKNDRLAMIDRHASAANGQADDRDRKASVA